MRVVAYLEKSNFVGFGHLVYLKGTAAFCQATRLAWFNVNEDALTGPESEINTTMLEMSLHVLQV